MLPDWPLNVTLVGTVQEQLPVTGVTESKVRAVELALSRDAAERAAQVTRIVTRRRRLAGTW